MSKLTSTPRWDSSNLKRHYRTRIKRDAGCFEDLLKLPDTMTREQYRKRSAQAVSKAWAKYKGEDYYQVKKVFRVATFYFVDEELVVAITDVGKSKFVTCYHKHYGDLDHEAIMALSVPGRKLLFRERLDLEIQGNFFRLLKWYPNV